RIKTLLDYKAQVLLDLIAGGSTTPGAGSSAALLGAVAASLAQTVAQHTLKAARSGKRREVYAPFRERADDMLVEVGRLGESGRRAERRTSAISAAACGSSASSPRRGSMIRMS